MSPKAIKLIRLYYYVDINSLTKIDIKEETYNEIFKQLTNNKYTEIKL